MKTLRYFFLSLFLAAGQTCIIAQEITEITLSQSTILADSTDYPGVHHAIANFQRDFEQVTGNKPIVQHKANNAQAVIIVGTIGKSKLIDQLISEKKINVNEINGQWEGYLLQIIDKPFPGVEKALVVAGSDKRGTIYGIYEISKRIGVSPWYWWADVPIEKKENLTISLSRETNKPAVQYRGIFINDEAPALAGWAVEKFSGFNHRFYEKVFELILRLKGNMLWPAMWGRAIYDDDSLSAPLADKMGVVIGTSHHEPMMRAHVEWDRYGSGEWNYEKNEATLQKFWKNGIERMGRNESIVTLGMRGDGDMAMSRETNVALLEKIVSDQREIITEVTGKKIETVPQAWALYKEVQDYYDEGMRVPEDVTLLLCDDNWGNIRKLPALSDSPRPGGYGVYYHFDYVGGPRNYKWINTNQVERTWEQMNLAWHYGVKKIWIVNVGDIKPMELPISFFLDMAWDPARFSAENIQDYTTTWAEEQFGQTHAKEIGRLLTAYTQFNARRKPELLSPETYSLIHYREWESAVAEYNTLAHAADSLNKLIPPSYRDAFFQLVLHPVKASANLNELYYTVALNRMYAAQGRSLTNTLADKVVKLFEKDAELSNYYNTTLADGKWSHMMDQTHIGYTYWQQPPVNTMPEVKRITTLSPAPRMGIAVEGNEGWWPNEKTNATLPGFDRFNRQEYYFEMFNRGDKPLSYKLNYNKKLLSLSPVETTITDQQRIYVRVNWDNVTKEILTVPVSITSGKEKITIHVIIRNPEISKPQGAVENNGVVSIEAQHYSNAVNKNGVAWKTIPGIGRTLSGISPFPVTASEQSLDNAPYLEYEIFLFEPGEIKINAYLSPTLNFHNKGLRYAIAVDGEKPVVVDIHGKYTNREWEKWVADNINIKTTTHQVKSAGKHTVRFIMIDPGIVLQKIVVERKSAGVSYLGAK